MTPPFILFALIAALFTVLSVVFLHNTFGIGIFIAYLLSVNLATCILYGYDKFISGTQMLRVPEKVLHLFALAFGSPAAFVAQKCFRHKTVKKSFQIWFVLIILLQSILVGVYAYWSYWR